MTELPKALRERMDALLHKMKRQESNYEERVHAKEGFLACHAEMQAENAMLREALQKIERSNSAGPSTDVRREWTWATAHKALNRVVGEKAQDGGES